MQASYVYTQVALSFVGNKLSPHEYWFAAKLLSLKFLMLIGEVLHYEAPLPQSLLTPLSLQHPALIATITPYLWLINTSTHPCQMDSLAPL